MFLVNLNHQVLNHVHLLIVPLNIIVLLSSQHILHLPFARLTIVYQRLPASTFTYLKNILRR